MNLRYFKNIIPVAAVAFAVAGLSSCTKDLDVTPIDPSSTMTPSEPELFTKCYATMALSGNYGGDSNDCDSITYPRIQECKGVVDKDSCCNPDEEGDAESLMPLLPLTVHFTLDTLDGTRPSNYFQHKAVIVLDHRLAFLEEAL